MITSTSLFSSDMNLNSDIPVQTGGAQAMTIIGGLLCCCLIFCSVLFFINDRKIDWLFTSGPNMGLMSCMMSIMCVLILYLAFTGREAIQTATTQITPQSWGLQTPQALKFY